MSDQENDSHRFDRLPETDADRTVEGRATRQEIVAWWNDRFGVDPAVFADYTFWEHGNGKVWAVRGEEPTPIEVEGLGIAFMRTRQEHWKPTLTGVQRFGHHADENVVHLTREEARVFMRGDDQEHDWDGDWGYLVVTTDVAGEPEPLGVGLYVYGDLRSQVPKGRRRDL